jgi:uncharacterized membrane protein
MLWVFYALMSAFSFSTSDAFTKKVSSEVDDKIVLLSRYLFGFPLAVIILMFEGIPHVDNIFWYIFIPFIPLEVFAYFLYIKAIRKTPISLVAPLLSFTPVFLILTSFLILGELPSVYGVYGILLVVIGAYVLNISPKIGLLGPFKSLFSEKGSIYMLTVALIFSITASLSKILVQSSSPMFASAIYLLFLSIVIFIILLIYQRKNLIYLKTNFKELLPTGFFYGLMAIFHNLAITLAIVPYMMSIKRTSSIFSVFYGHFWFNEKNMKFRIFGTCIMVLGAAIIILT